MSNSITSSHHWVLARERMQNEYTHLENKLVAAKKTKELWLGLKIALDVVGSNNPLLDDFIKFNTISQFRQMIALEYDLTVKQRVLNSTLLLLNEANKGAKAQRTERLRLGNTEKPTKCICFHSLTGSVCKDKRIYVNADPSVQIVEKKVNNNETVKALNDDYIPKTCKEYHSNFNVGERKDGIYLVKPSREVEALPVYCDMKGGGWMFINGLGTLFDPASSSYPLSDSILNSRVFKQLHEISSEFKSTVGDYCSTNSYSTTNDPQRDVVMQFLCKTPSIQDNKKTLFSFLKYWMK
ncbi:hypothetical protein C9374_003930 [Naegleria lovaniensis]|uniref:Fibrinogen C-terminal domain-containing protein n=1 Tax=Naegleria lovaniensis TaxID=51637 RepID=A0AA88H8Q0_NAELO|nr:uncharacterized protein C9374_003930 [Naegleria lovaniensis]KAG2394166.1 hypothetical protein C9374_003930 [Naegleria lovaniensis]